MPQARRSGGRASAATMKAMPVEHQRHRQQHAHGESPPKKAELRIGLAEEFADDPRHTVAERECPDDEAGPLAMRPRGSQARERRAAASPSSTGLVELARMPRQRPAAREHHSPGHVGRATPKLGVDEIRQPPEQQPDRRDGAGDVAERQDRNAAPAREQHHREHAADEAAVKRHAALPQLHDLGRVRRRNAPDCRTARSRCGRPG